MELILLMPRLCFIRLPVGHACLWRHPDGFTLIDAGLPGSAPLIAQAIRQAGCQPAGLHRVVLAHCHAGIAGRGEAEVLAHPAGAPFTRAQAAGPPPDLAGWERPACDAVTSPPAAAGGALPG